MTDLIKSKEHTTTKELSGLFGDMAKGFSKNRISFKKVSGNCDVGVVNDVYFKMRISESKGETKVKIEIEWVDQKVLDKIKKEKDDEKKKKEAAKKKKEAEKKKKEAEKKKKEAEKKTAKEADKKKKDTGKKKGSSKKGGKKKK
jgi:amphi-Trp domain-containing protein